MSGEPPPPQRLLLRDAGTAALTVMRTNGGSPVWPAVALAPALVTNENAAATVSVSVVTAWVPPGLYTGAVTLVGGVLCGTQTVGIAFECAASNIVAHWNLDEGGGTNVGDVTGHGYAGSTLGSPGWAAGWRGTALGFTAAASNQAVRIPYAAGLQPTGQLTISAWVKPGELTVRPSHAIYSDGTGDQAVFLGFRSFGTLLAFGANVGGYAELQCSVLPAAFTNGQWHLVTAVYDGSAKRLYVDGAPLGSAAAAGPLTRGGGAVSLAAEGGTNGWFDGGVDDVRLYARGLGATEVAQLTQTVPGPAPVRMGFNGTPEWWLLSYGLTNDIGWEEARDADGDGMPAWQECVAGTGPTNAASLLKMVTVAAQLGTNTLKWLSAAGSLPYSVAWSTNLGGAWLWATGGLARTPPTNVWRQRQPDSSLPVFYRVTITN